MYCRYTKKDLYESVSVFRRAVLGITYQDYPLRPIEIAKSRMDNLAIDVAPFRSRSLRGMAVIADNVYENDVILINEHLSPTERNFYCAHELMHLALHRYEQGKQFSCYDDLKPNQNPILEWQANEGAAELLLPYQMLLPIIKSADLSTEKDILSLKNKLAKYFGVTLSVVELRLESLKYEIYQHLNGVPLKHIKILSKKQQEQRGIVVQSLNDMAITLKHKEQREKMLKRKSERELEKKQESQKKLEAERDAQFQRALEKHEKRWLYGR